MNYIFFENMISSENREKVRYFSLEFIPSFFLLRAKFEHVFFVQHCQIAYFLHKFLITSELFPSFFHWNPSIFLCILFCSDSEFIQVFSQIYYGIRNNMLGILNLLTETTKSSSSQQSKCRWCIAPFGSVLRSEYSLKFLISSKSVILFSEYKAKYLKTFI